MSTVLSEPVRKFLDTQPVGTIATLQKNGKIRQTLVYFVLDGDRILISTESKRGKVRDVIRDGRASFCVFGHEKPFPACTVEGPARIVRSGVSEPTTRIMERVYGQRPAQPPTDEVLAAAGRVILEIAIERAYSVQYVV
jgi:PPOX class probable F420-dependent enzyme